MALAMCFMLQPVSMLHPLCQCLRPVDVSSSLKWGCFGSGEFMLRTCLSGDLESASKDDR